MSDFTVKRGDTIALVVGPILKPDKTPQDITGYTIAFTAKNRIDDADGAAEIAAVGTVTDGPAGLGEVEIAAAATSGFTTQRVLHWDVQITGPTGRKKTIDSGKMIVERDVTRA